MRTRPSWQAAVATLREGYSRTHHSHLSMRCSLIVRIARNGRFVLRQTRWLGILGGVRIGSAARRLGGGRILFFETLDRTLRRGSAGRPAAVRWATVAPQLRHLLPQQNLALLVELPLPLERRNGPAQGFDFAIHDLLFALGNLQHGHRLLQILQRLLQHVGDPAHVFDGATQIGQFLLGGRTQRRRR